MRQAVWLGLCLWIAAVTAARLAGEPGSLLVAQRAVSLPSASSSASQSAVLDINTATADQLKALPGMGSEYARRIIAGRPYSAKNQLVGRGVLPQSAYERIAARIVAHRPK